MIARGGPSPRGERVNSPPTLTSSPSMRWRRADPVLRQLIVHFRGMRVPQAPRVFEILISAIIEQQVNLSFAHKVKKALIDTYGRWVEFGAAGTARFRSLPRWPSRPRANCCAFRFPAPRPATSSPFRASSSTARSTWKTCGSLSRRWPTKNFWS